MTPNTIYLKHSETSFIVIDNDYIHDIIARYILYPKNMKQFSANKKRTSYLF